MRWSRIDREFYRAKEGGYLILQTRASCSPLSILLACILFYFLIYIIPLDNFTGDTHAYLSMFCLFMFGVLGVWIEFKLVYKLRLKHFRAFLEFLEEEKVSRELLKRALKLSHKGNLAHGPIKEMQANNLIYLIGKEQKPVLQRWVVELKHIAEEVLEEYINGRTAKL